MAGRDQFPQVISAVAVPLAVEHMKRNVEILVDELAVADPTVMEAPTGRRVINIVPPS